MPVVMFGPDSSETCGGSTGPVLGQVVDVPVVVQRQVRGQSVQYAVLVPQLRSPRSLTSLSWRSCRFPWSF